MVTGELKSKIDSLWEIFWTGGLTNPLDVIEQMTYLMFIHDLDESDNTHAKEAAMLGLPYKSIFAGEVQVGERTVDGAQLKWSVFHDFPAGKMYSTMQEMVFPFIKNLHGDKDSAYAKYMGDAIFKVPTPLMLDKIVTAMDGMYEQAAQLSNTDIRGDIYEYLLSKLATAGVNGQFRTPRHIIRMMVDLMQPRADDVICDPACGTAGFLVAAGEYLRENRKREVFFDRKNKDHYMNHMFHGFDMDRTMLRIGAMNMMTHGVDNPFIEYRDSLSDQNPDKDKYSLILANPPFKGSLDYDIVSTDLLKLCKTKKTELLFLALFLRMLKVGGRCACIVPDGVLFGKIKLGDCEKPQYRSFQWGTMIFTSTMAADILFYSLCEWALYANESQVEMMGGMQKWASTYPLFHWGPIAWGFYIVLAVAFGFMIHIRGRDKQKFSEACRPLLGSRVDGVWGRVIDLTAIFALIAGTATTFSLATPLLSRAISRVFGLQDSIGLTIAILLMIAAVYTFTVWFGMKGIAKLAAICSYCFFALLAYVLFGGGETRYILETGFSAIGNLAQNFIGLATWMDPLRETSFPQNWTIYYWAYWMVWCVATPFFIGVISKGRTIRNTILGGYGWGLAGTFTSFIILGNYGLAQQLKHGLDATGFIAAGGDYSEAIMKIFDTLPLTEFGLILLAVTMVAFYSTTFDALTMVVSSYSYKRLKPEQEPDKRIRTFWAVVFILLPIALIFSENSMNSLQSVSIIAAFPIGIIILVIVASFFKDASSYLREKKDI